MTGGVRCYERNDKDLVRSVCGWSPGNVNEEEALAKIKDWEGT